MLKSRRIPHPTHQLLSHCMSTLHKLYNEESSRIDFNTIEQLCEFLDVQVGEEGGSKISIVPNLLG